MAGRRQVDRHKVRVRIPRGIEIDRRLHTRPFRLRHRWVGAKQIIESQTRPPLDRTPAFDANQPRNLLMHRKASQEIANIERDAQARSEPIQSQFPSRNIARNGSSSVVVVLERGNLRSGVGGHPAIYRVERFCNIIVDTQCFVQKPLLPRGVHISTHTQATERILRQEKSSACKHCHRASPKHQKVSPALITQDPRSHSQLVGEVALQRSFAAFSRRQISLRVPYGSKVCLSLVVNLFFHCSFAMASDRFTLVDQPTIMLRSVSHPSAKTKITCGTTKKM